MQVAGRHTKPAFATHDQRRRAVAAAATPSRREVLGASAGVVLAGNVGAAEAVQGLIPGRVPGTTPDPELEGFQVYKRPQGKSGGHGVGWSEIPQYQFRIPSNWDEIPVSIADLGGTEIDVRFRNRDEGDLLVVVAPVLRFRDVGYNARVNMEFLGPPDKIISGFFPELYGKPLDDDEVTDTWVTEKGNEMYYNWEVKPHRLVTATATGNRVFLLSTTSNSRQWKRGSEHLKIIQESFYVPPVANYTAVGF